MLTRQQQKLIHVARRQLALTDEDYRGLLAQCGAASSRDLDGTGFELLMFLFTKRGFESAWSRRNFGNRPGMATARQEALIRSLWEEWTDGEGTDAGLGKWLERTCHVSNVRFLSADDARKAITGLKKMCERKKQPADAAT